MKITAFDERLPTLGEDFQVWVWDALLGCWKLMPVIDAVGCNAARPQHCTHWIPFNELACPGLVQRKNN